MVIALVGMPGGGKSSVGRLLAKQLDSPFVDSDTEIERQLGGESIKDYFARQGEASFRDLESRVIAELLDRGREGGGGDGRDMVLATGGGAVLRDVNRERLKEHSTVVYLRSSPDELFRRLRHDTQRPLLQVANPLGKLRELYAQRDPLYRRCAHFVLESSRPSVHGLANMILMQLELAGLIDPARVAATVGASEAPYTPGHDRSAP
ncbi:shikimate kinase [Roseateles aquatilis]|uniref:Shikimate kinase n=1 Tax=Roseateles aquatilis TaxID=431061 RepID=A0A246ITR8_9BURK|nr:shikimate kinase [Roseateles aquatilis]OWQ83620.1 shikimate kinase [Roseateles aquatilis]